MKKRIFLGAFIVILGLLIAIGPLALFHVCRPEDPEMLMKCHWTARAELGLGIVLSILGLLTAIVSSKQIRAGLHISVALNSILAFLIPNVLIGVCSGEHMHCHAVCLPALSILSVVLFITAIVSLIHFYRSEGKIKNE